MQTTCMGGQSQKLPVNDFKWVEKKGYQDLMRDS